VLLTHLHWDHTQGLPFFRSADNLGSRVAVMGPAQVGPDGNVEDFESVLNRGMSPPHFPVNPGNLRGQWTFRGVGEGTFEVEGFRVTAREIPHTGGRTFGYRATDGTATVAYVTDHCPTKLGPGGDGLGEVHPAAVALAEGCDLLVHDTQYLDEEIPEWAYFGHSCPGYALNLARAAGAKHLLLFHHDPLRTDDQLDLIVARYQTAAGKNGHGGQGPAPVSVGAACQGTVIEL
jgi:ribonuclease BN (tRNA processing enzyme)